MTAADQPRGLPELATLVRDCSVSGVGRRVLLLRSDLLPPQLSKPHHLRLAREALEPLMGADRARVHELAHGRIAVSWRGEAQEQVQAALDMVEHLLLDSPLDAPAVPELARLFELPRDGAALIGVASSPRFTRPGDADLAEEAAAAPRTAPSPPLDLPSLITIEERLAAANLARFARRRMVCRMGSASLTPAWEVRFLSIQELTDELCPGRNIHADPWLFRRLTRMLDRRMLSLLAAPGELRDAGPFSLDLNVGSILSPEFLRFDAGLPGRLRGHAVLNLHPADVMVDVAAFRFASAFARARGYRVLLRGIIPPLMPLLNLAALALDFVELRWSADLTGLDPAAMRAGGARWVLSRADDPDALRWGSTVGIGLFQGNALHEDAGLGARRSAA